MTWWGVGAAAVGTGISLYSGNQTMRKKDSEASAGIMRQAQLQREADAKIKDATKQITQSNPEDEKQAAASQYLQALQRNKQATAGATSAVAGASGRYAEDVAASDADAAAKTGELVKTQAAIDAPAYQRLKEGATTDNLVSQLGLINGQSSDVANLTKLKVDSTTENPWLQALGQGLTSYGVGKVARGGKVTPAGTGTSTIGNSAGSSGFATGGLA